VLSGPTAELLEFYFTHQAVFHGAGVTWAFLNSTIPFHSPHLAPVVRRFDAADRRFVGQVPGGDRLRFPVYATDGPRNMQESPDLMDEFLQQVLLRPIEWELVTRHAVADAAIDRILDCGPGAAARRFTRECLGAAARRLRFEPISESVASRELGGQHGLSALSGSGRTTPGNGRGSLRTIPGGHRAGG
jgi:malonyl CoA-acyl carrier protein transacylase